MKYFCMIIALVVALPFIGNAQQKRAFLVGSAFQIIRTMDIRFGQIFMEQKMSKISLNHRYVRWGSRKLVV